VEDSQNPDTAFRRLLVDDGAAPHALAHFLDALSHEGRLRAVYGLRRAQLQALYQRVEGAEPMTLAHLVPERQPALTPVRHFGRNSLPVFTHFEKRFYRFGPAAAVGGANFQSTSRLTGPGYFVAQPSERTTEVVLDYRNVPESAPQGWPPVQDNAHGVSRLVYGAMTDVLRRVSQHVSIGIAHKPGQPAAAYFVLCREL
jgi:hypothetical protein